MTCGQKLYGIMCTSNYQLVFDLTSFETFSFIYTILETIFLSCNYLKITFMALSMMIFVVAKWTMSYKILGSIL